MKASTKLLKAVIYIQQSTRKHLW